MTIKIQENSQLHIYQQIVNHIAQEILSGQLAPGSRLPTIRELARENNISLGTVKHAYDTLLRMGLTEMTQGKGTFVSESEQVDSTSKKEQAMTALDTMIGQMRELNFTHQEIRIYFDLKMREYEEEDALVTIGIIDCSPEALSEINSQLSELNQIEISPYVLEEILATPEILREDLNLFVTTARHFDDVVKVLGRTDNIMQMAMAVSPATIIKLAGISKDKKVGIIAASLNYAGVISNSLEGYSEGGHKAEIFLLGDEDKLPQFLKRQEVLIGFTNFHQYASVQENKLINDFISAGGDYISFGYEVDKGTLLYLRARIEELFISLNK